MPRFVDVSGPVAAAAEVKAAMNADFYVHVGDYGAVGDGVTDDTTAIQDAIDAAETAGGGVVHFPSGRFLVSDTLILPSGVQLEGTGTHTTDIYLADSSNCVVVQTAGFDELTGTNTALVSEGVPYGFGLSKIKIDGNKANNATAPVAVQWYGKGFTLFDVWIVNGKGGGLYTESAFAGYQPVGSDTTGKDAPEAVVYQLSIKGCHGHGWEHRGPHDMRADQMFIQGCKNPNESPAHEDLCRGLYVRASTDVYNASGDFGFAHIYDSDIGFECDPGGANFRFAVLISETSKYEGVILGSLSAQIGILKAYKNWRSGPSATDAHIIVDGLDNIIGSTQVRADNGGIGLKIISNDCQINAKIDGANVASRGVVVDGNRNIMALTVYDCDATGGVGVELSPTTGRNYNTMMLAINSCETGFSETTTGGVRNTITGSINGCTTDFNGSLSGNNVMVQTSDSTGMVRLPGFTNPPLPSITNNTNLGSTSLQWKRVYAQTAFEVRSTAGTTQPTKRLGTSGLEFGAGSSTATDCRIDRHAANVVRCYDKFTADLGIGVGNSSAATTLGSVTKKIEVFDETGSSLGFIPVYGSIT